MNTECKIFLPTNANKDAKALPNPPASPTSMKKRNTGPFLSLLVTDAKNFLIHSGVLQVKED